MPTISRRLFTKMAVASAASSLLPLAGRSPEGRALAAELPSDITAMNATQLSRAIAARAVSCREVMAAYLDRIERYNPLYNAIVALADREDLMAQAAAADRELDEGNYRGWMHGFPQAAKDLSNQDGFITSSGFRGFAESRAESDALFVRRMREAGSIFIGKTNTPEFGLGSQTYNDVYGITRNAYDPGLCAGGSSGGAAVALAAHMLPVADGSDMMGSLRNPGAYNNVIGFRPSQGRVPHDDVDVYFQQLGYEGPMGRTVEDAAQLLVTMSGHDPRMPLSLRDELEFDLAPKRRTLGGLRIAYMGDYGGYLPTEPGVLEVCESALQPIIDAGVDVEQVVPDFSMAELWETWLTLRHWTLYPSLRPLHDDPSMRDLLKPEAVWEMEGGADLTGLDLSRAVRSRSNWYRTLLALFEQFDFLVLPTAQVFPFDADVHWPREVGGRAMDTYHRWMEVVVGGSLSGLPIVNVPAGFDERGRPMGLQVFGPPGDDMSVLRFADSYTQITDHLEIKPELRQEL